jgi:phage terminase small subunit
MGNKKALNAGHRRFIAEYLIDLNATQAYIRAGYKTTASSADVSARRLLSDPLIATAIKAAQEKRLAKLELTADRVLLEVARLAYFDPRKLFNADGTPKAITDLDDDTAACIAGLEVLEQFNGSGKDREVIGNLKKYKVFDKNAALTNALKVLKLSIDKIEMSGDNGGPVRVQVYMPANGRDA